MATIQARIPDDIQNAATAVIKATGLTVSGAVRMFMMRIAAEKTMPLDLFQPNTETLEALQDAKNGKLTRTTLDGIRILLREPDIEEEEA